MKEVVTKLKIQRWTTCFVCVCRLYKLEQIGAEQNYQPFGNLVVDDSLQQALLLVACGAVQGGGSIQVVVDVGSIQAVHACMMAMCAHYTITFNNFLIGR